MEEELLSVVLPWAFNTLIGRNKILHQVQNMPGYLVDMMSTNDRINSIPTAIVLLLTAFLIYNPFLIFPFKNFPLYVKIIIMIHSLYHCIFTLSIPWEPK